MSLFVLFVIEFCGWIALNRITPFSVPRATIAMSTTSGFAIVAMVYPALWDVPNQTPLVNMTTVLLFGIGNTVLALSIAFVSFTRRMSSIS